MTFKRVQLTPAAVADINAIPDDEIKKAIVDALIMLEQDLEFGRPLGVNDAIGDLRGARKIYVDKPTDDKPRYRLVYWLLPTTAKPRYARVLAVGERTGLAAYAAAAERYNTDRAQQNQPPVENMTDEQLGIGE